MIGEKILTNSGYMGGRYPAGKLGDAVAQMELQPLRAALLEEWDNIPMRRINVLMNSMHRRIRAVTDERGGHTRY
jgi:hypothetical protein